MSCWRERVVLSRTIAFIALGYASLILVSCDGSSDAERTAEVTTGGNVQQGATAITRYGCGSCHVIPGISGAAGKAGPPLTGIADRIYIAGMLRNTPPNMMHWIEDPQSVNPKTVMPNLGVTPRDAADIAGYLYTLR